MRFMLLRDIGELKWPSLSQTTFRDAGSAAFCWANSRKSHAQTESTFSKLKLSQRIKGWCASSGRRDFRSRSTRKRASFTSSFPRLSQRKLKSNLNEENRSLP